MAGQLAKLACQPSSCAMLRRRPSLAKPPHRICWHNPLRSCSAAYSRMQGVPHRLNAGLVTPVNMGRGSPAERPVTDPLPLQSQSCACMLPFQERLLEFTEDRLLRAESKAGLRHALSSCSVDTVSNLHFATPSACKRLLVSSSLCFWTCERPMTGIHDTCSGTCSGDRACMG